jgi:glucose/mannose-6-phosphate isomerase
LKRGASVVIVSSDGLLEEYAGKDGVAFVRVVKGIVPRTALPHMLYGVLGVLDSSGYTIVSRSDAEYTYVFIRDNVKHAIEEAHRIASFIAENKGLLILATHTPFEPLILRGKNEFNENSKIPVKVETSPEWMHNDIVGWEKPFRNKYSVVTVCDGDDRVGSRLIDFMEDIYRGLGIPVYRFVLRGESFLDKLLYGSLVFGLASVKLARIRGLDPMVTETIRKYKEAAPSIFSGFES